MKSKDRIYRELQNYLDTSPEGFPSVESGADIRILKRLFTPEEAQIGIRLSFIKPETVENIHQRLKQAGLTLSAEKLKQKLSEMVLKGTILAYREGYPETRYQAAGPFAGGIYDFQVNRLTPDMIHDFEQYHKESSAKPRKPGGKRLLPLRTVPVAKSIPLPLKHLVSSYEDVRKLVQDAQGPIAVANCICRQSKDLQGQKCQHTDLRESCLQIGTDHARQYVDMGIARYITREEAYEILEKAEKAGLILQPENSQRPEAICCCCGDCCALLSSVTRAPRPAQLYTSNYYVEVIPELCNGCKACVERCQVGARIMKDNIAIVDLDRCIGCGNCVVACRPSATRLVVKPNKSVPPANKEALFLEMLRNTKDT